MQFGGCNLSWQGRCEVVGEAAVIAHAVRKEGAMLAGALRTGDYSAQDSLLIISCHFICLGSAHPNSRNSLTHTLTHRGSLLSGSKPACMGCYL